MRLRDLNPRFIQYAEREETWTEALGDPLTWRPGDPTRQVTGMRQYYHTVETLAEAQGIFLQCPLCVKGEHPHYFHVTFAGRGVPDHLGCYGTDKKPTRWAVQGTNVDDLTTTPSIQLIGGCNWHGYITNGDAA